MADNIAGQTSASSNDQLTNGTTQGSVVYDATTIVAADSTRVFTASAAIRALKTPPTASALNGLKAWQRTPASRPLPPQTRTLETTNGGITVDSQGFRVLQNATLGAIAASKTCYRFARN